MDTRKPVPERRFRRAVGVLLAPHLALGREDAPQLCASARARPQRGLLDGLRGGWGSHRLPMALHAPHPASSVGGALPAEAAVDKSGPLRGGAPRLARTLLAPFGGPGTPADGRHTRLADPAFYPAERLSGRLRDGAKPKKGSKVHAAVDALGDLLALHVSPADEQKTADGSRKRPRPSKKRPQSRWS
jgi:hypothetical protein